jgi:hypothetical protein
MLLLVLLVLLGFGVTLLMLTGLLVMLKIWLLAIIRLCEGQFIKSGFWLCLGIMLLNLFFGEGDSFTPLYVAILGLALIADIGKRVYA